MQNHNDTINKQTSKDFFRKMSLTLFVTFACERELVTEQNCNILTLTLMAVSVVSISFSRAAQPEAQGPSSLLDDGFLYCILLPTGLQNSIGGPEGPFGRVWLSLPHLVSDVCDPQLLTSYQQLLLRRCPWCNRWGGARGVIVIVVGSGHGDTSSNPGRDSLHFT